jgi:hypothetical protein
MARWARVAGSALSGGVSETPVFEGFRGLGDLVAVCYLGRCERCLPWSEVVSAGQQAG